MGIRFADAKASAYSPIERRPVPGWPGYYVDTDGRVYSTRYRVRTAAGALADAVMVEKRQFDRGSARGKATPYRSVCLSHLGRHENRYVHELVALAFLGPRPDGAEILHGAEGSRVNRLSNLRYGSPEQNSAERVLCRGADWYRARGLEVPAEVLAREDAIVDVGHCFEDLLALPPEPAAFGRVA